MADTNYEDLVKQAEQAVAPVKDPELKRIAFEKILDALLEAPEPHGNAETKSRKSTRKRSGTSGLEKLKAQKKRAGTAAYIEELIDEQFFAKPKTIAAVKAELANLLISARANPSPIHPESPPREV